jgi:hypothetical protein
MPRPKLTKEMQRKGGRMSTRSTTVINGQSRKDLARLAEYGLKSAKKWLDRVAEDNPGRAFALWIQLLEYTHPKLSRRESINIGANIEISKEEREKYIKQIIEDHVNRSADISSGEADVQQ